MAGTLVGVPLTPNNDVNGRPLVGCLLYIYQAGTTTPVTAYSDTALTDELSWPIVGNSLGRISMFWLPNSDGEIYRAKLTSASGGVVCFDEDDLPAIGPADEEEEDAGTDAANGFQTGDYKWRPQSDSLTGFVRANGRTIGSAASGATERANADCEDLFLLLWATLSDTYTTVVGGRGATAASDWAAGKQITLVDMRARVPVGLDDMGNSVVGRLTSPTVLSGTPTTPGGWGGIDLVELSVAQVPTHTHAAGTLATASDGAHTHGIASATSAGAADTGFRWETSDTDTGRTTDSGGAHTHTVTGETASSGSSDAHGNMPPFVLGTWYIRL